MYRARLTTEYAVPFQHGGVRTPNDAEAGFVECTLLTQQQQAGFVMSIRRRFSAVIQCRRESFPTGRLSFAGLVL